MSADKDNIIMAAVAAAFVDYRFSENGNGVSSSSNSVTNALGK